MTDEQLQDRLTLVSALTRRNAEDREVLDALLDEVLRRKSVA